ncbi:MAG TPA: LUD domain-containing protein [Mucilaginibacter sp.]|nr:LUD domain-containing protein [Mucilaginibacter sp.]
MSSRDKILEQVNRNQPANMPLPSVSALQSDITDPLAKFTETLKAIGGAVLPVRSADEIRSFILDNLKPNTRKVTTIPYLADILEPAGKGTTDPHSMENVDYAIIAAQFGVAENGAVWVTEDLMQWRILPFICQHLFVVLNAGNIVADMHRTYDKIGLADYGFGAFIAGPSKTADIEQSLVIGAHGPRSMTVFLMS